MMKYTGPNFCAVLSTLPILSQGHQLRIFMLQSYVEVLGTQYLQHYNGLTSIMV